jgi:V/A-type H+-transporting ATPase subunit E
MALQDILDKINTDAKRESNKIKAESEEKIAKIDADTEKEIKAIEEKTAELSEKKYEEEKRLKISLATLELKNKLLASKQSLIDEAFEKALSDIKALPVEKYKELLISALLKVDAHGDEEVILGASDSDKLGASFVDDINAAFKKAGNKADFKLLKETRDNITGCVLKDGRKETICTFESIIKGKRKELEKEVASLLFKE